ncbi:hypothetical protein FRACYDRAFT_243724 [Fragilariopsis cylindrus CCMP1102]|uniref:Uncharacterized protein n=1 Tax=Fragilariopsis cylindrus CCMP1102 TaxID=635003 RepID=A0A1E7F2S0_9STRA|nr:hypothetical protein FRACYDRAFT_243724 [Fragilariopsis cylindrus CCMP1102]|eukprot:OEU12471.1 hypothetical protein FRACYDRAFT_243724 [Fragilariopsis cylindrus CCMP1102]
MVGWDDNASHSQVICPSEKSESIMCSNLPGVSSLFGGSNGHVSASVLIGPFKIICGTNDDDTTSIPCGAGTGIATGTGAGTGAAVVDGTGVAMVVLQSLMTQVTGADSSVIPDFITAYTSSYTSSSPAPSVIPDFTPSSAPLVEQHL